LRKFSPMSHPANFPVNNLEIDSTMSNASP
jgi:hypothetical protein